MIKDGLFIALVVVALLVVGWAFENLPPLQALLRWLATPSQADGVVVALMLGLCFFGILLLAGTQLVVRVGDERSYRRSWDGEAGAPAPKAGKATWWRRASGRFRGWSVGVEFSDAASLSEVKQAWRNGAWRTEPRWQRFFLMILGGLCLVLGMAGFWYVVGPLLIKLIVVALLGYGLVRTVGAVRRA